MSQVIIRGPKGRLCHVDVGAAEITAYDTCAHQSTESPAPGKVDLPEMHGDFCGPELPEAEPVDKREQY